MPPAAQQGSRAGLISALVIFVILFVTTTILFIYQTAETRKRDDIIATANTTYARAATPDVMASQDYNDLIAESDAGGAYAGMTAVQVAVQQRKDLTKAIVGTETTTSAAVGQAQAALKRAADQNVSGGSIPPTMGLAPAIGILADSVVTQRTEKEGLNTQLAAAQQETQSTLAAQKDLLAQRDTQIMELSTKYAAAEEELKAYRATVDTNVAGIEQSAKTTMEQSQAQAAKLATQVGQQQVQMAQMQQRIRQFEAKLGDKRTNVKEPIVQVADGRIARLPGNSQAYINLGSGDQVSPGMTFEVYDKYTGVPPLGDGLSDTNMPVGKASLEVIRVSPGSSECRIIRKSPGQEMIEGDLIANLVYDPKTKYNFVVYGEFDLDRNGIASTADAEVIKRLVTQWGGKVQSAVNVDTDFIIMGKEPVVPDLSDEQKQDPVELKRFEDMTALNSAYLDVVSRANQLHIPVMNQNRFLYFCGYYSQAPR